jgi:Lipase (class 3)
MGVTSTQILAAANLAFIAYDEEDDQWLQKAAIIEDLGALKADANGPWTLTWGPADNDGVLAYVAQGADGTYALAFRGSLIDDDAEGFLENWLDDVSAFVQVPWLYPQSSGANIAAGNNAALALAIGLTDPTTDAGLLDYLRSVAAQNGGTITLAVCGHSLGGALTTIASVWIADQLPKVSGVSASITPFTFAAPTIGDAKFAALYDGLFAGGSYACVNTQDMVPMAWANLAGLIGSFGPVGETLDQYSFALWLLAEGAKVTVGSEYVPVKPTHIDKFVGPAISASNDWPTEAGAQHSMQFCYLPHVQSETSTAVHA